MNPTFSDEEDDWTRDGEYILNDEVGDSDNAEQTRNYSSDKNHQEKLQTWGSLPEDVITKGMIFRGELPIHLQRILPEKGPWVARLMFSRAADIRWGSQKTLVSCFPTRNRPALLAEIPEHLDPPAPLWSPLLATYYPGNIDEKNVYFEWRDRPNERDEIVKRYTSELYKTMNESVASVLTKQGFTTQEVKNFLLERYVTTESILSGSQVQNQSTMHQFRMAGLTGRKKQKRTSGATRKRNRKRATLHREKQHSDRLSPSLMERPPPSLMESQLAPVESYRVVNSPREFGNNQFMQGNSHQIWENEFMGENFDQGWENNRNQDQWGNFRNQDQWENGRNQMENWKNDRNQLENWGIGRSQLDNWENGRNPENFFDHDHQMGQAELLQIKRSKMQPFENPGPRDGFGYRNFEPPIEVQRPEFRNFEALIPMEDPRPRFRNFEDRKPAVCNFDFKLPISREVPKPNHLSKGRTKESVPHKRDTHPASNELWERRSAIDGQSSLKPEFSFNESEQADEEMPQHKMYRIIRQMDNLDEARRATNNLDALQTAKMKEAIQGLRSLSNQFVSSTTTDEPNTRNYFQAAITDLMESILSPLTFRTLGRAIAAWNIVVANGLQVPLAMHDSWSRLVPSCAGLRAALWKAAGARRHRYEQMRMDFAKSLSSAPQKQTPSATMTREAGALGTQRGLPEYLGPVNSESMPRMDHAVGKQVPSSSFWGKWPSKRE